MVKMDEQIENTQNMREQALNLFGQQSNLYPDERQIIINSLRKISTSVGLNIFDMYKKRNNMLNVTIKIPKEFESHWNRDRFKESLERLSFDANEFAGNYERELVDMLIKSFQEGEVSFK